MCVGSWCSLGGEEGCWAGGEQRQWGMDELTAGEGEEKGKKRKGDHIRVCTRVEQGSLRFLKWTKKKKKGVWERWMAAAWGEEKKRGRKGGRERWKEEEGGGAEAIWGYRLLNWLRHSHRPQLHHSWAQTHHEPHFPSPCLSLSFSLCLFVSLYLCLCWP